MIACILLAVCGQTTTLLDTYISTKDSSFKWNLDSVTDVPLVGKVHHLKLIANVAGNCLATRPAAL